jgi:hypothetical protein
LHTVTSLNVGDNFNRNSQRNFAKRQEHRYVVASCAFFAVAVLSTSHIEAHRRHSLLFHFYPFHQ